jgi:hypothetical protein
VIVDAQSVKTTDLTKNSGYDGGKKISGIKRPQFTIQVQHPDD